MGYPFSLDFSIESSTDRLEEVRKITSKFPYLSQTALELLANYVMYGKDPDGKSPVQRKEIKIQSRYNPTPKNAPASLDELTEKSLTGEVRHLQTPTKFKTPKQSFPRKDYENDPRFKDLYTSIDELRFIVNVNDGKISPETETINEETGEITSTVDESLKKKIEETPILDQYPLYLLRHTLIEKQKEQYTLRELVNPTLQSHGNTLVPYTQNTDWGNGRYEVGPAGLYDSRSFIFQPFVVTRRNPYPPLPTLPPLDAEFLIDFRKNKHVYRIIYLYREFEKQAEIEGETSFSRLLLQTFYFYFKKASLSHLNVDLLRLKIAHVPNIKAAELINKKYGTNYTTNYISSIYTQQIIPKLVAAAVLHKRELYHLHEPDRWMRCRTCGKYKLLDETQFCYRAKSSNGFSSRCKECDRVEREKKREENLIEQRKKQRQVAELGSRIYRSS